MTEKGLEFEVFVKRLMDFLHPQGVQITPRDRFYDEETKKQIAEIDITLRFDSAEAKSLIGVECRLRPSKGPMGVDWITQVAGKRDLVQATGMIAVSATGFTETAVIAARTLGVDLRIVEDVEKVYFEDWFRIFDLFSVLRTDCKLDGPSRAIVRLDGRRHSIEDLSLFETAIVSADRSQNLSDYTYGVAAAFLDQQPSTTTGIKFHLLVSHHFGLKMLLLNNQWWYVEALAIPIVTWREQFSPRILLSVFKDPSTDKTILLSGRCHIKLPQEEFKIVLLCKEDRPGDGTKTTSISLQTLTMDNRPYYANWAGLGFVIDGEVVNVPRPSTS